MSSPKDDKYENTPVTNLLANTYGIKRIGDYSPAFENLDSFMLEAKIMRIKTKEAKEEHANHSKTPSVKRSFSLKKWLIERRDRLTFSFSTKYVALDFSEGVLQVWFDPINSPYKFKSIRLWWPRAVPFQVQKSTKPALSKIGEWTVTEKFSKV